LEAVIDNLKSHGIFENKKPLFIEKITVHKRTMELSIPFETSFGRFSSLVRFYPEIIFKTEEGELVKGIGECSPLNAPWYNYECHRSVETALKYIVAGLTGKDIEDADGLPAKNIEPVTNVHSFVTRYKWIVGHNTAKCGAEGAYWNAVARLNKVPVSKLWGGTRKQVETGTSIGLEADAEALLKKIDIAVLKMKATRIKVKVKPGKDISYIEAIRKKYPYLPLQVDANASYDLFNPLHIAILQEFDNYNLMMIEQPGGNDDIYDHSRQLAGLKTPICLDESILHTVHARQAIDLWKQYSSVDRLIINIKPPRVGGYFEAIKIAGLCNDNGVSAWCGGMFESAIGKTANIHFSSRIEVNLPGDHISQAPYFKNDIADSPEYNEGKIEVPAGSGWGLKNIYSFDE